jgi:chitinase
MVGWFEEWAPTTPTECCGPTKHGVANVLTHVIYAFADPVVTGSNIALADTYADYQKAVPQVCGAPPAAAPLQGNFGALVQLKQLHPNLKVLVSLGGYSPTNLWNTNFATASSTAAGRTAFVSSCINMFLKGNIA